MKNSSVLRILSLALSLAAALTLATSARGQAYNVLHSFNGVDGDDPTAGLIFDAAGNLYGTTLSGGSGGFGNVFKLSLGTSGWTETTLYSFTGGSDGSEPFSNLIFDRAGNLYGTTFEGGSGPCDIGAPVGCRVVFKLTPNSDGTWTESVIHSFNNGHDGSFPVAGLTIDAAGNLYGAGTGGARNSKNCGGTRDYLGCGTIFELSPGSGGWKFATLYAFTGGADGGSPYSNLIADSAGNLYGTALVGGCSPAFWIRTDTAVARCSG